jgi:hypothetical protein
MTAPSTMRGFIGRTRLAFGDVTGIDTDSRRRDPNNFPYRQRPGRSRACRFYVSWQQSGLYSPPTARLAEVAVVAGRVQQESPNG